MELGVEMFIRFKDKQGIEYVRKIKNIYLPEDISYRYGEIKIDKFNHNTNVVSRKNILKASNNIIDLIEYGDFITLGENNYPLQVRNVWEHAGDIHIELSNGAKFEDLHNNKDFKIYSIVTKEQFEAMEYKID